uniref:Uncharacterized protein n=1 Tax=Acrobeloides nanus TaxID=290746 RepID=A0A914D6L0_9BILA
MEAAMKSSCTSSDLSVHELVFRCGSEEGSPPLIKKSRRKRTISGSKSEDHMLYKESRKKVYTKGRPPYYDRQGKALKKPYVIGI